MSAETTNPHELRKIMVDRQVRPSDVTEFSVIEAMLSTPRERYLPRNLQNIAYIGDNIALEKGRVVLEARITAKIVEALNIQRDEVVLDIGCGFGYSAAVLACFSDIVIALEENENWAERTYENLCHHDLDHVVVYNGVLAQGVAEHGPYNVIIIEGAVEQIPDIIISQLAEDGRICTIFRDENDGGVQLGQKKSGKIIWKRLFSANAPILHGFSKQVLFEL